MAVRIVTDSTADIPPALAQELGISVVPLTIFFGEESFLDGVELDASTFMAKLTSSAALPRTTQPVASRVHRSLSSPPGRRAPGLLCPH